MGLKKVYLKATCDASGDATVNAPNWVLGFLYAIAYLPGTIDTNGDITVSVQGPIAKTLLVKANAGTSNVSFHPRTVGNQNTDGAALTVYDNLILLDGKIRLVVAQGGNGGAGAIILYYFDD